MRVILITRMPETRTLLLEIGVEELPSSFVDAALAALPALAGEKLAELRLVHRHVRALGTPRRLAIVASELAEAQLDLDEEVVGPPEAAAFKDGRPTKAAEAFAAKLSISLDALAVVEKPAAGRQKAGRYVTGRRVEKGRPARELLGKALAEICAGIPFKKSMRWGAGGTTFGRPVHWIVALFGRETVDVAFAGVRSGRESRGHRFLAPEPFALESADEYVDALRARHVIVDREERARAMMERVSLAAKALGGVHDPDASLVVENASLVEEPFVVTGSFDRAFLELPAAVIRAVARGHQKYFCVQDASDPERLLPHYLAVANTALDPGRIAKGNDSVMRARLADARFFFEEDKKAKLEDRIEKLGGIVFHHRLGTVKEKVARIESLAAEIARDFEMANEGAVRRAARLCKADLVSLMVGEFPELQGHMGRAYALLAGEPREIADAICDHYRPVGASDDVPPLGVSAVLGLADRLDTLTGCFAIGLSPTGAADPFALRRACISILRTLIDRTYASLSLVDLVRRAYKGLSGVKLDLTLDETTAKVVEFAAERLRRLLSSSASGPVADAVMTESAIAYPVFTHWRATALQRVVDRKEPWLANARTVSKRLAGISKSATPKLHRDGDFSDLDKNRSILRLVQKLEHATHVLDSVESVEAALREMPEVADGLEKIFLETLVNDPADPETPKRLELLSYGARCMLKVADFSRLA
jgi:glycyl-tRNA synthetase beta chain